MMTTQTYEVTGIPPQYFIPAKRNPLFDRLATAYRTTTEAQVRGYKVFRRVDQDPKELVWSMDDFALLNKPKADIVFAQIALGTYTGPKLYMWCWNETPAKISPLTNIELLLLAMLPADSLERKMVVVFFKRRWWYETQDELQGEIK